jgi:hypothetical protein
MALINREMIVAILTASALVVSHSSAAQDSVQYLSYEESIGAIFVAHDSEFETLFRVDPRVLPVLRRTLKCPELWSKSAWTALGCVGTERDVTFVRGILEKEARGEHDPRKSFNTAYGIKTVGLFARRDVAGSRELLADIQQGAFWEGAPIRLYKGDRSHVRSHDEIQALILETMGYANDPGVAKRYDAICAHMKDSERLANWKHRVQVDRLLKVGKSIDRLEKQGVDPTKRADCLKSYHELPGDKRKLLGLPAPPTPQQLAKLWDAWRSRRIMGVVPNRVLSKSEAEMLVHEAQKEYERFTVAITQKDVKTMRESLMSKGELFDRQFRHEEMTRPEITRLYDELDQLQKQERDIIKLVSAARPEAVDTVASLETDAGDYSGNRTFVTVVSWKLKGTQDIGKSLVNRKMNTYPTLAEDDNLMVVMKKKDGVWYWNPFGW